MSNFPEFPEGQIEALALFLGKCGSGSDITRVLNSCKLTDNSGESTKWRRLYHIFLEEQKQHKCANQIINFIKCFLIPARFVGRSEDFENHRKELNAILAFSGLEFGKDGEFRKCQTVHTLDEAEARVRTIESKFQGRIIHPEVLKYCRAELLQDNYFHAVFEATKGLAQRIRNISNVNLDGAALIDRVFPLNVPF